jgi:radical SAM-linked protein
VVQRIRLRYTKRGRLRFTSHRDFQRALERALRRSAVPMAYSAGFTPHPRISFMNAASTGAASEAEYVELALAEHRDPELLRKQLDESLPPGLDVIEAVEATGKDFMERLQASVWELRLDGVEPETARSAVAAFLAAESVEVQRQTKNGLRTFDARGAVVALDVVDTSEVTTGADIAAGGACAILRLVVRHATPAVRPDDVLSGLRATADLALPVPAGVTRLAQGPLDEESGAVTDPFASDRDAATALGAHGSEAAGPQLV